MPLVLRLLAAAVLLGCLASCAVATRWLLDDRALEQRGSVTEGVVSEVRERLGRDQVVVSLDLLDGRPVTVTKDGATAVGRRLQVEYDPDGGAQVGRVAGSERDRRDGRLLLAGSAGALVLVATLTPWRRRARAGADPE
ncbi:MAG: hypothetical protein JWN08_3831 [Frankiales bacterium]|nr:hypothetical protein [Frankiales bacterium]